MSWHDLDRYDVVSFIDARLQTHYAIQWLVRAASIHAPQTISDAHKNALVWNGEESAFTSKLDSQNALHFGLRVMDLTLLAFRENAVIEEFPLDGQDELSAGQWISDHMKAVGLDPSALSFGPINELPHHRIADEGTYDTITDGMALTQLAYWLANANSALTNMCAQLSGHGPSPAPLTCCARSFKFETSISVWRGDENEAEHRTIQAGFSPGDQQQDDPYFFVILSRKPRAIKLPDFIEIGSWHANGFIGAIAPASEIIGEKRQEKYVLQFLHHAVDVGATCLWTT